MFCLLLSKKLHIMRKHTVQGRSASFHGGRVFSINSSFSKILIWGGYKPHILPLIATPLIQWDSFMLLTLEERYDLVSLLYAFDDIKCNACSSFGTVQSNFTLIWWVVSDRHSKDSLGRGIVYNSIMQQWIRRVDLLNGSFFPYWMDPYKVPVRISQRV